MPRRERLSPAQRSALIGIGTDREDLTRHYTLNAQDRELLATKRSDRNRLGFAVQLAYLRHPGQALGPGEEPPAELLAFLARQLQVPVAAGGLDALGLAGKQRPDLILLDVSMPDLTGVEVIERLRAIPRLATVPVIMLTGHSQRDLALIIHEPRPILA